MKWRIIDTFDDFLLYWEKAHNKNWEERFKLWQEIYMAKYPELLRKQIESYKELDSFWLEKAKKEIFSKLEEFLPLMKIARRNLFILWEPIYYEVLRKLNVDFPIVFVIYVGIGSGAGWATIYKSNLACLLGLEKIAELKWHSKDKLKTLLLHEIGHLVHMKYRKEYKKFEKYEKDPLFLLYSEGFAKRFVSFISGKEKEDKNWVLWCRKHKKELIREYLNRINYKKKVNDFFGDWLNVKGKSFTGYFLGREFIRWLEEKEGKDIRKIAILPFNKVQRLVKDWLFSQLE
ncbi:MAG: hypothetical protein ABIN23_04385 [candidate division WOR-3 bacterium]